MSKRGRLNSISVLFEKLAWNEAQKDIEYSIKFEICSPCVRVNITIDYFL